jgi:hypothetical protein
MKKAQAIAISVSDQRREVLLRLLGVSILTVALVNVLASQAYACGI